jgi:hypothetical protein
MSNRTWRTTTADIHNRQIKCLKHFEQCCVSLA